MVVAVVQVLVVRFLSWRLGKTSGGDAGALVRFLSWRLGKTSKVFVLAKRVAVTQVLLVRFVSCQNACR